MTHSISTAHKKSLCLSPVSGEKKKQIHLANSTIFTTNYPYIYTFFVLGLIPSNPVFTIDMIEGW